MSEFKSNVKPVKFDLYCDECASIMQYTGHKLDTEPPQLYYQCTNPKCNHAVFSTLTYPRIEFEKIKSKKKGKK